MVLRAGGQIVHGAIWMLANRSGARFTLLLRNARKLTGNAPKNSRVVQGDVLDRA
jgi:hypothetical protein